MKMIRTYSELCKFRTFQERFDYLKLDGVVGETIFGFERYLNQVFYQSGEWKAARRKVINRDNGCDLGLEGYDIMGIIYVHHINPITPEDIRNRSTFLLDPEFLICTSRLTHEAITLGAQDLLPKPLAERFPNDTCPWKRGVVNG